MNSLKKPILLLLLATFAAFLSGCETRRQKDTAIPWSRPAGWGRPDPRHGPTDRSLSRARSSLSPNPASRRIFCARA